MKKIVRLLSNILICVSLLSFFGCGDKIARLDDKLRRTINEGGGGRLKVQIDYKAGFTTDIDRIEIKPTYKDDYTYVAIVTFKEKDVVDERKRQSLPQLGNLPTVTKKSQVKARFRYFEVEDRWYLDQFIQ